MTPFVQDADFTLHVGDALEVLRGLPDESVHMCVTSPPYWGLRDYGAPGQLGLEATPDEYVAALVAVFREVRRMLRGDGTLWLNLGDSYGTGSLGRNDADRNFTGGGGNKLGSGNPGRQGDVSLLSGVKPKDLVGVPWRVAFALQADGWYLRSDIIWSKPNPMPESVTDRPTKSHEYVFLLTRSPRYFFDQEAVREAITSEASIARNRSTPRQILRAGALQPTTDDRPPVRAHVQVTEAGRNLRSVWEITTQPFPEAHFATFPEALPERCIKAGCPAGGIVLDPFLGSGTVALVARRLGRRCIGIELSPEYARLAAQRTRQLSLLAGEPA